jgi:hypothetical protein
MVAKGACLQQLLQPIQNKLNYRVERFQNFHQNFIKLIHKRLFPDHPIGRKPIRSFIPAKITNHKHLLVKREAKQAAVSW